MTATNATCSYTWANEICAGDNEQRAVVISSMNGFQYAVAAWLPILIFPQTTAPTFRRGFPTTFGLVIAAILAVLAIQYMVMRDRRKAAAELARRPSTDSEEGGLTREQVLATGKDDKISL